MAFHFPVFLGPGLLPDDEAGGGTRSGDDKEDELFDFLKGSGGVTPNGEMPGNPGGVPSPANNELGPPILGTSLLNELAKNEFGPWVDGGGRPKLG